MSRERIEVQIEPITGKERDALRGQDLSQGVDHPMSHMLGAGDRAQAQVEFSYEDQSPARARVPGLSFAAVCEFHPTAGAEGAGCGSSAHGRAQRACLPE